MAPDAEGTTGTTTEPTAPVVNIKPEPTSEKLQELVKEENDLLDADLTGKTRDEKLDHNLKIFEVGNKIKAEKAAIAAAERDRERAEKLAERTAILDKRDAAKAAWEADNVAIAKIPVGKRTPEQIEANNALNDEFKKLNEVILNALIGNVRAATAKPAGAATTSGVAPKGTSAEIREKLLAHVNGGVTLTEAKKLVMAEGYTRGTTGTVATQLIDEGLVQK